MLSLVTAEVGQKYCSITSVSCFQIWVWVKECFIFKSKKNIRNAASRFIFYASSDQRKFAAYTNLVNIFFSPLGGLKLTIQPDGSSWCSQLHSFWFYHTITHTHTHTRMHARTHTHTQTHPYLGSLSSILIKHHHWMAIKGHNYGTKGCGCACCGYFTITWMLIQNKQDTQRPLCSNVVYKNPLYTLHLCFPRSVLDEMLKMKWKFT